MKSKAIPESIIDAACETVAAFSDEEARQEVGRLMKLQPALMAYVMATTEDLSTNGSELGLYMFIVIHRMYEMHFGKKLQNVGIKRVEEMRERNESEMESLVGIDESLLEESALSQTEQQPWVARYVVECLFAPDDDGDEDTDLSEEDQGSLFLTMKTVIDSLDSSVRM